MNNAPGMEKSYIQTYTPIVPEPTIKQEIVTPMTNLMPINSCQILPGTLNQTINLQPANESIEYMPNELDDGNIQGNGSPINGHIFALFIHFHQFIMIHHHIIIIIILLPFSSKSSYHHAIIIFIIT